MYGNEAWFDRTHNMPIEWLVSGGVLGFLAYLTLFVSLFWALLRGVKNDLLSKNAALIFVGMIIAYLIRICFVFDILATYLMLTLVLGFFSAISISSEKEWLKNDGSNILKSDAEKKPKQSPSRKNSAKSAFSFLQKIGIAFIFVLVFILIFTINIKPFKASQSLIYALNNLEQKNTLIQKKTLKKLYLFPAILSAQKKSGNT